MGYASSKYPPPWGREVSRLNDERKKALQCLKTAKGQIEGIIKMIEDDRYCIDISNQILASQSLLKKANMTVLKQHMQHCVKEACHQDQADEKIDEVIMILEKIISK